jgi:hypothetical protein
MKNIKQLLKEIDDNQPLKDGGYKFMVNLQNAQINLAKAITKSNLVKKQLANKEIKF